MSAQSTSDPGAVETRRIDAVSADPAEEAPRGAGHEPINVLIVDDEPANLVVLETVLDDPGYRLVRAQSADQALYQAKHSGRNRSVAFSEGS